MLGVIIWLLRRRRSEPPGEDRSTVAEKGDSDKSVTPELDQNDPSRAMLDGKTWHELHTKERPGEAGGNPIYELPYNTSR